MVPAVSTAYEDRAPADSPDEDSGAPQEEQPANLYASLGDITNLAVVRSVSCLFTRIVPFGIEGVAQTLSARRELTLEHSRQWLNHVGLRHSIEELEGDPEIIAATREILNESAAKLADEFRLSLDYYGTQQGAAAINEIVFCGAGTTVPDSSSGFRSSLDIPVAYPGPPRFSTSTRRRLRVSPFPSASHWRADRAPRRPDPTRAPPP